MKEKKICTQSNVKQKIEFRSKVCRHCGIPFYEKDAREYVDTKFGIGKYDSACEICGCPLCRSCASEILQKEEAPLEDAGSFKPQNIKKCCHCNNEYDEIQSRDITDTEYGTGRYDWVCETFGPVCFACACMELYIDTVENKASKPITE